MVPNMEANCKSNNANLMKYCWTSEFWTTEK
jgi:hypothetical protein